MNRVFYRILAGIMWLALPLTAILYWQSWGRLPAYMATHFNAANQPNGWMTREASLWFALGITALLLTIFSVVLFIVRRKQGEPSISEWALLGFFYLIITLLFRVNSGIVDFSLYKRPIDVGAMLLSVPVAVVALIALFLASHRGKALRAADVIAVEEHGTRYAGGILLLAALAELWILLAVPVAAIRLATAIVGLVLLAACAMAWSGFRYYFTRQGIEIRTLGFRLRSIPSSDIREYAQQPWSAIGGYGIRGVGNRRAYVWGNKGVLIKTSAGEVFLGHGEPERLVHNLDAMMKFREGVAVGCEFPVSGGAIPPPIARN